MSLIFLTVISSDTGHVLLLVSSLFSSLHLSSSHCVRVNITDPPTGGGGGCDGPKEGGGGAVSRLGRPIGNELCVKRYWS